MKKMTDELLPAINPQDDGDFEFQYKIEIAKDLYMKGHSVEEVAARTDIGKWHIHRRVFKGRDGDEPWVKQRERARTEFIAECQELSKVSLSKTYRSLADTLFECMGSAIKDIHNERLKPYEKIKLMDTLIRGIKEVHNIFMPAMKTPLVNIALQNDPKMSEADIMEKLIDWGLESKKDENVGNG